jgi:hypothetical protein
VTGKRKLGIIPSAYFHWNIEAVRAMAGPRS